MNLLDLVKGGENLFILISIFGMKTSLSGKRTVARVKHITVITT